MDEQALADVEKRFANPDGSPATWREPYSSVVRWWRWAWRAGLGLLFSLLLLSISWGQEPDKSRSFTVALAMTPLLMGVLQGYLAYLSLERRRYAYEVARKPLEDRMLRVLSIASVGVSLLVLFWGKAWQNGTLLTDWPWGAPALALLGWAAWESRAHRKRLTDAAQEAKAYFQESPAHVREQEAPWLSFVDNTFVEPVRRRFRRLACLASEFQEELQDKFSELIGKLFNLATHVAHAAAKFLLFLGLVVVVGLLIEGLSRIPVSIAILVGAIIIAGAIVSQRH